MEWPLVLLSFAGLMLFKCVLLHYTMKLANWYKNRQDKPKRRKYKDIYDYDFMHDYESGDEEEDLKHEITDKSKTSQSNVPGSSEGGNDVQRESELQTAAKKLLCSIRQRREQTAAALLNVSKMDPDDTSNKTSGFDPREFLRASKYYEYLKDHLGKEGNWEDKKKS